MHTEHRALVNNWKWNVFLDCPVVLIALDYCQETALVEKTVQALFEQHALLVQAGQLVVSSCTDFTRWVETRQIVSATNILERIDTETKPCWQKLFSTICHVFKNREIRPHAHIITSSDTIPLELLKEFEGNLILHIHQMGKNTLSLPTDLPASIEIRQTTYSQ